MRSINVPTSDSYIQNFNSPPDGKSICYVCGRLASIRSAYRIWLLGDRTTIIHPNDITDEIIADPGFSFEYVGPECFKHFSELKGFAVRDTLSAITPDEAGELIASYLNDHAIKYRELSASSENHSTKVTVFGYFPSTASIYYFALKNGIDVEFKL